MAVALLPEVGNDALAIHLLVASHVRDFGYWHYDVQRNVLAVTPLAGEGATGLIVTMRAIADPNRTVVAVLAERPRATSTEVVLSIAAAEPVARDNALKAFGLPH